LVWVVSIAHGDGTVRVGDSPKPPVALTPSIVVDTGTGVGVGVGAEGRSVAPASVDVGVADGDGVPLPLGEHAVIARVKPSPAVTAASRPSPNFTIVQLSLPLSHQLSARH